MLELICTDSMRMLPALMERLKPCFDMIWLDPPYFDWDSGEKKPDHRDLSFYVSQLIKPNGAVFLCGTVPQLVEDYRWWSRFFDLKFEITQVKNFGSLPHPSYLYPLKRHENIWCYVRKGEKPKLDLRRTSKSKGIESVRIEHKGTVFVSAGRVCTKAEVGYMSDVFECQKIVLGHPEYVGHPTQKPKELMRQIIRFSTEPGDWILDPFAGSGTTGIVAEEEGRNCLMMELKKEYIQMIKKRMDKLKKQPKILDYTQ